MNQARVDRRKEERFFLGLPVKARVAERTAPLIVELTDISASGARFQAQENTDVVVDENVAFGFVVPGWPNCQAKGQITRVERTMQFAVTLDDTNEAFDGFIRLLAAGG
jgi:PilZ domain